jgi:3-deoxy-manno-octulosonate cytidylyltransferase (CMP-KDO synthetase)
MKIFDCLVVAADSLEVQQLCESLGAPVVMTDPTLPSGTARVAQVVERPEFREFSWIVNIQGDEPLVEEAHLTEAVRLVEDGGWDVGTCATPVRTLEALKDPNTVKVARAANGRALYFSRARIPHKREGSPDEEELGSAPFLRHVGLYAYAREALSRWVALPPSTLGQLERLEQLRALEAGMRIGVAVVDRAAPGVDTPADIVVVEEMLSRTGVVIPMKDWT